MNTLVFGKGECIICEKTKECIIGGGLKLCEKCADVIYRTMDYDRRIKAIEKYEQRQLNKKGRK